MIHQILFDNTQVMTFEERHIIIHNYMNKLKSINQLSDELGIDRLIIRKFISDYLKALENE
jgi:hypothetical protein